MLTAAVFARAHRGVFVATTMTLVLILWGFLILGGWLLTDVMSGLPTQKALREVGAMAQATTIYDANDRPAFTFFNEYRVEVPLSGMSPHLIDAVLAVEDQRFYVHGGVDVIRVAGAAWGNLRDGWGTQGGSTITQQIARQSFLTSEKTLRRKLKEVIVAARLEREFSKAQILEWYLNKVYFGDGLYGIEAASLGYFGKHASDLDVAEAALLAGLIKAPSTYAPTVSVDRAIARRKIALNAMRQAGMIDAETFEAADRSDLELHDGLHTEETYGQYFKDEVRKQLEQQFGAERVYEGGLKVYTTMDPDLQRAAEAEILRAVKAIQVRRGRSGHVEADDETLQGALVALDPSTGEVRALVGGRSFDESPFNRATQSRRQAGSAFKPFVYAAALERGYTPGTLIAGLSAPLQTLEGAWLPDDHSGGGPMTMRTALRLSSNSAAVATLMDIGIPSVIRMAERFGLESVPGVPSMALGSGEVTPLAMTAAYAAFANAGMRPEPQLIRRIETADGEVLFSAHPRTHRAVSEATAFLMTSMLSDVVNGGTGRRARRSGLTAPAAGKTGTTNGYRDAWFIGYTPSLAAGVWIGYDYPRTIAERGYGGTIAAPVWGRFMAIATRNKKKLSAFRRPRAVTGIAICRISGKRATDACRHNVTYDSAGYPSERSTVYTEYFARGTEPAEYCNVHVQSHVADRETAASPVPPLPAH